MLLFRVVLTIVLISCRSVFVETSKNLVFPKFIYFYTLVISKFWNTICLILTKYFIYSVQCNEQTCEIDGSEWVCLNAETVTQTCKSENKEDICFEWNKLGRLSKACASKSYLFKSDLEQLEKSGRSNGYCNTPLCNNQLEFPKKFRVDRDYFEMQWIKHCNYNIIKFCEYWTLWLFFKWRFRTIFEFVTLINKLHSKHFYCSQETIFTKTYIIFKMLQTDLKKSYEFVIENSRYYLKYNT